MKLKSILLLIWLFSILFSACKKENNTDDPGDNNGDNPGTLTDFDGNIYQTVKIGDQVWMAEDLKTTHYNDGTDITEDSNECSFKNNGRESTSGLYNFHQANNARLCPVGTHLPSVEEWQELIGFVAHDDNMIHGGHEATALKATYGWYNDGNGTDDYGFAAFAGGYLKVDSTDNHAAGKYGHWWTTDTWQGDLAWSYTMKYHSSSLSKSDLNLTIRISVRCVKD
jgi:uncharacterized protein (TIGR02145 family)